MFVTLMTWEGCHTICLPETKNGKYWLRAIYSKDKKKLMSIEAIGDDWCIISNEYAAVLDDNDKILSSCIIKNLCFYKIRLVNLEQHAYLITEPSLPESISYMKFVVNTDGVALTI